MVLANLFQVDSPAGAHCFSSPGDPAWGQWLKPVEPWALQGWPPVSASAGALPGLGPLRQVDLCGKFYERDQLFNSSVPFHRELLSNPCPPMDQVKNAHI